MPSDTTNMDHPSRYVSTWPHTTATKTREASRCSRRSRARVNPSSASVELNKTSPLRFTLATALLVLGGLAAFYLWMHGRPAYSTYSLPRPEAKGGKNRHELEWQRMFSEPVMRGLDMSSSGNAVAKVVLPWDIVRSIGAASSWGASLEAGFTLVPSSPILPYTFADTTDYRHLAGAKLLTSKEDER